MTRAAGPRSWTIKSGAGRSAATGTRWTAQRSLLRGGGRLVTRAAGPRSWTIKSEAGRYAATGT
ncbi:hypothetical protein, partial [Bhargavaea ullalensis]